MGNGNDTSHTGPPQQTPFQTTRHLFLFWQETEQTDQPGRTGRLTRKERPSHQNTPTTFNTHIFKIGTGREGIGDLLERSCFCNGSSPGWNGLYEGCLPACLAAWLVRIGSGGSTRSCQRPRVFVTALSGRGWMDAWFSCWRGVRPVPTHFVFVSFSFPSTNSRDGSAWRETGGQPSVLNHERIALCTITHVAIGSITPC